VQASCLPLFKLRHQTCNGSLSISWTPTCATCSSTRHRQRRQRLPTYYQPTDLLQQYCSTSQLSGLKMAERQKNKIDGWVGGQKRAAGVIVSPSSNADDGFGLRHFHIYGEWDGMSAHVGGRSSSFGARVHVVFLYLYYLLWIVELDGFTGRAEERGRARQRKGSYSKTASHGRRRSAWNFRRK
jgi:hypothetical protein